VFTVLVWLSAQGTRRKPYTIRKPYSMSPRPAWQLFRGAHSPGAGNSSGVSSVPGRRGRPVRPGDGRPGGAGVGGGRPAARRGRTSSRNRQRAPEDPAVRKVRRTSRAAAPSRAVRRLVGREHAEHVVLGLGPGSGI
jgi:hypothetical protein